ncbi:MauE/DoxX family redox-associated membrane protein [Rugosimonospora africana]|uniref:Methylamine utilisation protein MauE domain-containing protein n=1 Tax=Rugosimonospora africana TaxID=556532 RepID=A0A8J3VUQ6_9ACTN|nr:MauE/DoxX family redox-associated membrane protein [Rugosimonospora africana]GIH19842.1 hypothetical protein Raf01_80140 [Rugosimonospora africana]
MSGYLLAVACWALVIVLAVAAWRKAVDSSARTDLAATVRQGLRFPAARAVAYTLPGVEAATALLLGIPATRVWGSAAAVVVFAGLSAGASVLAHRDAGYRCGCFGASATPITWRTAGRGAALGLTALLLLALHRWQPRDAAASLGGFLTAGLAATLVGFRGDILAVLRAPATRALPHRPGAGTPVGGGPR